MRRCAFFFALVACGLAAGPVAHAEVVGWRGNWTGKFPDANPPVKWGKISKQMKGLRCQAEKPRDDRPAGVPAFDGSLTRWLVAGPFPADEDAKKAIEEDFLNGEANCRPKEGDAVGGVRWKKVEIPGSKLDLASVLAGEMPAGTPAFRYKDAQDMVPHFGKPFVAYAHTYVYSPMDAMFRFRVRAVMIVKLYVNGNLIEGLKWGGKYGISSPATGEFSVKLNRGWNRVLCKVNNFVNNKKSWRHLQSWYVDLGLRATGEFETETEGIAWATLLPSYHIACPLVVGDKVFAMSKPGDLVCMRKSDGKVLWIGTTTYYDLPGNKDNPAFAEVAPLVLDLKKADAAYVARGGMTEEAVKARIALHKQVTKLMGKADKEKYGGDGGHYVAANMPTPVSDGKHVYVWSELGIATCYDLDGNRKWIKMPSIRRNSGGRYVSPVLAGGNLILTEGTKTKVESNLMALDVRNGNLVWSRASKKAGAALYQSLVPVKIGGDDYVLYWKHLVRAGDGQFMLENGKDLVGHIPTPVIENGIMYGVTCRGGNVFKAKLPTGPDDMSMKNEGKVEGLGGKSGIGGEPMIPSPLYHEGLLYVVNQSGYLHVVDTEKHEIVYERDLGMGKGWPYEFYHAPDWEYPTTFASPILAGKYIYVFGLSGTAVVLEPGRQYKEVARNKIEDCLLSRESRWFRSVELPELFASSPVADGDRIYLRGGNYLYCIGKPGSR